MYLLSVSACQYIFGCQGLLDEGDNSMDDEETGSKVSVSIMCGVYYLVQDGAGDSIVTITEETPTKNGDKVIVCYVFNVCMLLSLGREMFLCQVR